MKKKSLGKGLDALFEDNSTTLSSGTERVRMADIVPNKEQPRRDFDLAALEQLAASIREHGVIQPLVLRPMPNGTYQIVAGERRYRASRMAGLLEVPAVVQELTDQEAMELALIENLQREDLNPLEEAQGYQALLDEYHLTQEEIAKSVGKSRPVVANALRLLHLPEPVLQYIKEGALSAGHARALCGMDDPKQQIALAEKAVKSDLTVREVEKLAKNLEPSAVKHRTRDHYYEEMEVALTNELGRRVQVQGTQKKGKLTVEFYGKEDLRELADRLLQLLDDRD
jgi:ParB family chromosome partitioning protein